MSDRADRSWPAVLLRLVVALAVLGALYAGAAWYLGRHVPGNTQVAGIPIGGKSPADAEATLQRELAADASAPLTLQVGTRTATIDPSTAGLELDIPATLDQVAGPSWQPARLWDHLTGGHDVPLINKVDDEALDLALTEATKTLDVKPTEGGVGFSGAKVVMTEPVEGVSMDIPATAGLVATDWPATTAIKAVTTTTPPQVSAEEIERAGQEFATKAVSGPVTVRIGEGSGAGSVSIPVSAFLPAVSLKPTEGRLEPVLDGNVVTAAIRSAAVAKGLEKTAKDATVRFDDRGGVEVVPSVTGVAVAPSSVAAPFLAALTSEDRTAVVKTTVTQPKFTTEAVTKTRPRGTLSTFTTTFPDNAPRTSNIKLAAGVLDGTYVQPGAEFSLNALLGQRTPGKGYQSAGVIEDGRLTNDYGGGISQLSTTLFNAVFFSGARIEEFHPHSFYISRYPEGREATISWPDVDQKFTNDTAGGILIRAYTSGNDLTVTFYGTKTYEIEATKSERRDVTAPQSIRDTGAGCVPQSANPGFSVDIGRIFKQGGKVVKTSKFTTRYQPQDAVTCG